MCEQHKKDIYKHSGMCDDKQNLNNILDASMVSTPEVVTYDSPNAPMTSTPVKKSSVNKSLCLFTKILNVKQKISKHFVVIAKSKRRAMKVGTILWTKKKIKRAFKNQ